tara:strand:- start:30 stop:638 length:609 start_codon:yes stop_codon:yes gene_type:complete
MDKEFIIGIPIRDFNDPMTRLSNDLSLNKRVELMKHMFLNIVKCFQEDNVDIFCITRDNFVVEHCNDIGISTYSSKTKGLSTEASEFIKSNSNYAAWTICHADLPYLTKYYAKNWINECLKTEILISESKDSGTPIIGGKNYITKFHYGENSFKKHTSFLNKEKIPYRKVFHQELNFEIDDSDDYKEFIKNQPRWYRKIEND